MPAEIRTEPVQPRPDGPFSPDQLGPTAIMALVAVLGGCISFYGKWKAGKVRFFNVMELIGELFVSAACGVGAYWVFKGFEVNPYLTAAGVAVVGHMGTRAIFMAEQWVEKKVNGAISQPLQSTGEPDAVRSN